MRYTKSFFESREQASSRSADCVLPFVFELVRPKSVVDFGCGTGTWLDAAKRLGVSRVLGFEGDWIRGAEPLIGTHELEVKNLDEPVSVPDRFDLAISLEVAEHLKPERAAGFVHDLCGAAPVVLFGAAIPEQGGTGHIHERWQSYWASLFVSEGYRCLDVVRPRFWDEALVMPWYKQNAFLYASESAYEQMKPRLPARVEGDFRPLDVVHPDLYLRLVRDPPLRLGTRVGLRVAAKLMRTVLRLPTSGGSRTT
jgi:SAM-dependent methyltransferase